MGISQVAYFKKGNNQAPVKERKRRSRRDYYRVKDLCFLITEILKKAGHPKLSGRVWHDFRRGDLGRTERKYLGRRQQVEAEVRGRQERRYQKAMKPLWDAIQAAQESDRYRPVHYWDNGEAICRSSSQRVLDGDEELNLVEIKVLEAKILPSVDHHLWRVFKGGKFPSRDFYLDEEYIQSEVEKVMRQKHMPLVLIHEARQGALRLRPQGLLLELNPLQRQCLEMGLDQAAQALSS